MFSSSASALTDNQAQSLKNKGITDVFVCTRDGSGNWYYGSLQNAITKLHKKGIKVHAWINCFHTSTGFVNPSTSTTVKTITGKKKVSYKSYYKYWYKKYYKHYYKYYYKYKGKWYHKHKYGWKYTWKHITKYKIKYKYVYTYKNTTTSYQDSLIKGINYITANYDVDGIHLDYVRYPGTAHYYKGATNIITNFVAKVHANIPNDVQLSCAVMSEGSSNAYYYGQDYSQLTKYVDFLAPMTYAGNYNQGNAWITSMTKYIVAHSNGKPVYTGLTTYYSDFNLRTLAASELYYDVQSAKKGGAKGFVLFRYGYGTTSVPTF